jgi:hypothetical protein
MRDTTPASDERYFALLREKSAVERLDIAIRLTRSVRELAEAGIRALHPNASSDQIRAELAARLYGAAVADRLFPGLRCDDK